MHFGPNHGPNAPKEEEAEEAFACMIKFANTGPKILITLVCFGAHKLIRFGLVTK